VRRSVFWILQELTTNTRPRDHTLVWLNGRITAVIQQERGFYRDVPPSNIRDGLDKLRRCFIPKFAGSNLRHRTEDLSKSIVDAGGEGGWRTTVPRIAILYLFFADVQADAARPAIAGHPFTEHVSSSRFVAREA